MQGCVSEAWNNFVMLSNPEMYGRGSSLRNAAIAALFMGMANNGGLNSFLTCAYDLDAQEVLEALGAVGASKAATQLETIMLGLGISLPASSQEERWNLLDINWTDELDNFDLLRPAADEELLATLERHVFDNEAYYRGLTEVGA